MAIGILRPVWLLLLVAVLWSHLVQADEKPRLAVLNLAQEGAKQEAEAIAEELRRSFVNSGRYVVIDRTLTEQIFKEWELQQSGMTEREKAIKIGKLFNVQLIVSGKLNKFPSGGWQVSAVMLDAQSGITKKADIVRHRGDFFSLLDTKVPQLASALVAAAAPRGPPSAPPAGAATVPPPGVPSGQAAPAAVAARGAPLRLALFPELIVGTAIDVSGLSSRAVTTYLVEFLKKQPENSRLAFSYADKPANIGSAMRKDVWDEGLLGAEPDLPQVLVTAKPLGVDAVLMAFVDTGEGVFHPDFYSHLYVIDVVTGKQFKRFVRSHQIGDDLMRRMDAPLKAMLQEMSADRAVRKALQ